MHRGYFEISYTDSFAVSPSWRKPCLHSYHISVKHLPCIAQQRIGLGAIFATIGSAESFSSAFPAKLLKETRCLLAAATINLTCVVGLFGMRTHSISFNS
jgi:hypothetical protein